MNFGLFNFWIPLVLIIHIYHLLPGRKWKNLCLLITSYGFYIFIDWRVFPCLLISTATDYIAGFLVTPGRRKSVRIAGLLCSLSINLGLLFTFKYIPELFHTDNEFVSLLKSVGLPLGISFYTFQTISYTLDCYKGHIKPTSDIVSFALYVSFFPQLAAGPIERAKRLLPQFQNSVTKIDFKKFKEGFYLILLGLFKKVYVAGALIHPLKRIYETNEPPPSLALISGFLAVCLLYFDFSSYSDLARGIAKFFGINLIVNFKPFVFSKSPREFWRKVHISMHKFILDYLMRPGVEIFKKKNQKYFISFYVVFLFILVGLWHKASLNWLLTGIFNGIYYVSYHFCNKKRVIELFPFFLRYVIIFFSMFFLYTMNGLLYYSDNFETFIKMSEQIIKFNGFGRETFDLLFYLWPFLLPLFIYEWFQNKYGTELFIMKSPFLVRAFWIAFAIVCIFVFERNTEHTFIYFGF